MEAPRFEMQKCLGAGGFGEVYLATEHTEGGLTREVAMKVLHEHLDESSDAVKRLRDEGQLLALLAHPAIMGVHEFAHVDDRLALVTEYVAGADLAWFCVPERLLPLRAALQVTLAVAEALDFAWNTEHPKTGRPLHLIHRDVKPENVRIARAGQVKVLDFGVARSTEIERRAKTASGQVILTPGYGAPETLQFGVLGPAVDVFALGVTLYAMVTGQNFYVLDDIGAQVRLASDSLEFERYLQERLDLVEQPDVHSLLRDMLEFAHEHRPTMAEVAARCDRLAHRIDGPTLRSWSKQAEFPAVAAKVGRLDGAVVDDEGHVEFPEGQPQQERPKDSRTWITPEGEPPEPPAEEPSDKEEPASASSAPTAPIEPPPADAPENEADAAPEPASEEQPEPVRHAHVAQTILPTDKDDDELETPDADPPEPEEPAASQPPADLPERISSNPSADATPLLGLMVVVSGGVLFLLGVLLIAVAVWMM